MSEEESYANHIIQKHRLAVTIAVIKSKPETMALDHYLTKLRDIIETVIISDDESISDSLSSKDFDFDNENDTNCNDIPNNNEHIEQETFSRVLGINELPKINIDNKSYSKSIDIVEFDENGQYFEPNCNTNQILPEIEDTNTNSYILPLRNEYIDQEDLEFDKTLTIDENSNAAAYLNDSMNILEGFGENNEVQINEIDMQESQVLTEVFSMIKNVDQDIDAMRKELSNSQATYCESQNTYSQNLKLTKKHDYHIRNQNVINDDIDSQGTIIYALNDHNYTHVSQSQLNNITIDPKYINNNGNSHNLANFNNTEQTNPSNNNINYDHKLEDKINTKMDIANDRHSENIKKDVIEPNKEVHDKLKQSATELDRENEDGNSIAYNRLSSIEQNEVSSEEEPSTSSERLPFKIIEEMNKVKSALNKSERRFSTDGFSTDSGYRSDSQKSQRNSLHVTENWLNQSGCSLFRYILNCSLSPATQDINNEISQVLGNLIDRLHAEEKYPTFLEEILQNIDKLLKELHEHENNGDDPLEKEEQIYRLTLLNKSIHIQKFTIGKITAILEETHLKLTDKHIIYELHNIDQIENLSYVFNLLEILIKKYIKSPNMSQSSQKSQSTDSFKRSSLTEVWRKKWNIQKEDIVHKEVDKLDILNKCREILNKIIVDCMTGYSLIAYAALQCFNLLQN